MTCPCLRSALLFVLLILPAGCEVDYFAQLIGGELASLGNTVPLADALNDARLSDDERAELEMLQEMRQFGIDRFNMVAGDAYTVFEWNGTEPAAYVISASAKESLTSYVWFFPFLGFWQAKGYFDEAMALREAARLEGDGWDVFVGEADGFSTLGFLPDPIRQSNLQALDEVDLAELIFHEMTHSTVFKPSDMDFSESLATFVGRTAAQGWFDERYGAGSELAQAARIRFADKAVVDDWVNEELYGRLSRYYEEAAARGETRDQIIAGRDAEFDAARAAYANDYRPRLVDQARWGPIDETPINNAMILAAIRYQGSLSDYQAVLDKLDGDLPAALAVFSEAVADAGSREYLRRWVAEH